MSNNQTPSQPPLKVFLCHSSRDKARVRELYHRLRQDGIEPWLDEEDLVPGQNWETEIPKAVGKSDVVLVCISLNAMNQKGYVHKEIKFALDEADKQPEDTVFIIPVKLEECNVPQRLSHLHWVNFFEERGYKRLMDALNLAHTQQLNRGSKSERAKIPYKKVTPVVPTPLPPNNQPSLDYNWQNFNTFISRKPELKANHYQNTNNFQLVTPSYKSKEHKDDQNSFEANVKDVGYELASYPRRLLAFGLDFVLTYILWYLLISFIINFSGFYDPIIPYLFYFIIMIAYLCFCYLKIGRTPGQSANNLWIVHLDNSRPNLFIYVLNYFIDSLTIFGFFIALKTNNKQTLGQKLTKTVSVHSYYL